MTYLEILKGNRIAWTYFYNLRIFLKYYFPYDWHLISLATTKCYQGIYYHHYMFCENNFAGIHRTKQKKFWMINYICKEDGNDIYRGEDIVDISPAEWLYNLKMDEYGDNLHITSAYQVELTEKEVRLYNQAYLEGR